jgi:hypothetical protein
MFIFVLFFLFLFSTTEAMNPSPKIIKETELEEFGLKHTIKNLCFDNLVSILLFASGENPANDLKNYSFISAEFKQAADFIFKNYIPGVKARKFKKVPQRIMYIITQGTEKTKDNKIDEKTKEKLKLKINEMVNEKSKENTNKSWNRLILLVFAKTVAKENSPIKEFLEETIEYTCDRSSDNFLNRLRNYLNKSSNASHIIDRAIVKWMYDWLKLTSVLFIDKFLHKIEHDTIIYKCTGCYLLDVGDMKKFYANYLKCDKFFPDASEKKSISERIVYVLLICNYKKRKDLFELFYDDFNSKIEIEYKNILNKICFK